MNIVSIEKSQKGFQKGTGTVRSVSEEEYNGSSKKDGDKGNKFWNWKVSVSDQIGNHSNNLGKK